MTQSVVPERRIELYFDQDGLSSITFWKAGANDSDRRETWRGKGFKWVPGTKAVAILLCRWKAWYEVTRGVHEAALQGWQRQYRRGDEILPPCGPVCIARNKKNLLATLEDCLWGHGGIWVSKVFGSNSTARSLFVIARHPQGSRIGLATVAWLNVCELSPGNISIKALPKEEELTAAELLEIAARIEIGVLEANPGNHPLKRLSFRDDTELREAPLRVSMLVDYYRGDLFSDAILRGVGAGLVEGVDGRAVDLRMLYLSNAEPFPALYASAMNPRPDAFIVSVGGGGDLAGDLDTLPSEGLPVLVVGGEERKCRTTRFIKTSQRRSDCC